MSMISSTYLKQIDDLYDAGRHQEIYDKLRRPDGNYSAVPAEILWRFARAIRYLSKNFHFPSQLPVFTKGRGNKNARKAWLAEALGIMKMAVEKYPSDCYCNTVGLEFNFLSNFNLVVRHYSTLGITGRRQEKANRINLRNSRIFRCKLR